MKIITLKFAGRCADCGADLPVGSKAKWCGRGRVYGIGCHEKPADLPARTRIYREGEPLGLTYSRLDCFGVYTPDGQKIGSTCGCIDYPCCGH